MEEDIEYCGKCGGKLILKITDVPWYMQFFLGAKKFDPYTGERVEATHERCENARIWNTGHHSVVSCDRL